MAPLPKRKHSHKRTKTRESQRREDTTLQTNLIDCKECGGKKLPHQRCKYCGK